MHGNSKQKTKTTTLISYASDGTRERIVYFFRRLFFYLPFYHMYFDCMHTRITIPHLSWRNYLHYVVLCVRVLLSLSMRDSMSQRHKVSFRSEQFSPNACFVFNSNTETKTTVYATFMR